MHHFSTSFSFNQNRFLLFLKERVRAFFEQKRNIFITTSFLWCFDVGRQQDSDDSCFFYSLHHECDVFLKIESTFLFRITFLMFFIHSLFLWKKTNNWFSFSSSLWCNSFFFYENRGLQQILLNNQDVFIRLHHYYDVFSSLFNENKADGDLFTSLLWCISLTGNCFFIRKQGLLLICIIFLMFLYTTFLMHSFPLHHLYDSFISFRLL